jgi:hypothetical protein
MGRLGGRPGAGGGKELDLVGGLESEVGEEMAEGETLELEITSRWEGEEAE